MPPGKRMEHEVTTHQHRSEHSCTDSFCNLILALLVGTREVVLSSWSKHPERYPGNSVTLSKQDSPQMKLLSLLHRILEDSIPLLQYNFKQSTRTQPL